LWFAWASRREIQARRAALDVLMVNGAITWCDTDVNALHFVHDAWRRSAARQMETQHGPYGWYHRLYTAVSTAWERWALRHTRHAVAVSPMVENEIRAVNSSVPVHVIPNGVDPNRFSPDGPTVPHADIGCPPDAPLALFVGDIRTHRKNLDTVLRALTSVPALHLAVAGTVDSSPFPALAADLGLEDRVHFLGFRRDTAALMRTAHFLVCPSRYDPFSLVQLEGMACGRPVITASTVGASALVTPNSGIVLDDPTDVEALAPAMTRFATQPELCRQMGRAARAVARRHDLQTMARQYVDLFEAIHGERSLPTAVETEGPEPASATA
jgi:glycosyltransferase involved in cell wall biosynthesis